MKILTQPRLLSKTIYKNDIYSTLRNKKKKKKKMHIIEYDFKMNLVLQYKFIWHITIEQPILKLLTNACCVRRFQVLFLYSWRKLDLPCWWSFFTSFILSWWWNNASTHVQVTQKEGKIKHAPKRLSCQDMTADRRNLPNSVFFVVVLKIG